MILDNIIKIAENEFKIDYKEKFNKDIELNSLSYEDAINYDKRIIIEYYK